MLKMGKLFWWKQFTPLANASPPKFLRTTIRLLVPLSSGR
jgi:hypothetical protein